MDIFIAVVYVLIFILIFYQLNYRKERQYIHNNIIKYAYPISVILFIVNRFTYIPRISDLFMLHVVLEVSNLLLLAMLLFVGCREIDDMKKEKICFCVLVLAACYHIISAL